MQNIIDVESILLWAEKAEEEEEARVSDVCRHSHPLSTHIYSYDGGDASYGSLDLSPNSIFLFACGSLVTSFSNVLLINQSLSSSNFLALYVPCY